MNIQRKYLPWLFLVVGNAVPLADINKVAQKYSPRLQIVCRSVALPKTHGFKFNSVILEQCTVMPAIFGHGVCESVCLSQ